VIKLSLRDLDQTGHVVGRLSAIGTAGALTGTFLTGFVLVSALPNAPVIIGVGVALAVAGCALERSWRLLGAAIAAGLLLAGVAAAAGRPCEVETAYFCARVVATRRTRAAASCASTTCCTPTSTSTIRGASSCATPS
jgi:hypothetical protein